MRTYRNYNEDYELGYERGRRDALKEFNEDFDLNDYDFDPLPNGEEIKSFSKSNNTIILSGDYDKEDYYLLTAAIEIQEDYNPPSWGEYSTSNYKEALRLFNEASRVIKKR